MKLYHLNLHFEVRFAYYFTNKKSWDLNILIDLSNSSLIGIWLDNIFIIYLKK